MADNHFMLSSVKIHNR